MPKSKNRVPGYCKHKATGQAVVTLGGRDIYLGKYNSAASRHEYNRLIAEWTASGGTIPKPSHDLTVSELLAAFLRHAELYYRDPSGKPTGEVANFKLAVKRLKEIYGRTHAADFGPLALKAVRGKMIADDWSRGVVNHAVNRIRHIFKWGVENELVPASILHGLQAVAGLRAGRTNARETAPIRPVPDAFVEAVLPHVSRQAAAMIELQRITGMRSGEVCLMRTGDINMAGKVWVYVPETHKTAWHGHERKVYLGPQAQAVVKPFLKADLTAYLFSTTDAEAERNERRFGVFSPDRKTKVYPCEQRSRAKRRAARSKNALRHLGDRYDTASYRRAIDRGIDAANKARLAEAERQGIEADKVGLVPHWHPHQLRHNAATNLRREHGIEIARIILGHRSAAITEVYAEVDHVKAIDVMARIG